MYNYLQEVVGYFAEQSVDVITGLGGRFQVVHAVPLGELVANLARDLPVVPVRLVPDEHFQHLRRRVLLDLSQPVGTAVECGLLGYRKI